MVGSCRVRNGVGNMGSADEKGWQLEAEGRSFGLHVILLKREYILPWVQFLYAEGTEDSVRAVFSTHDVEVQGRALTALLADLASQRVSVLRQPSRADTFKSSSGPQITAVEVRRVEQDSSGL
jgi:hypothetical protein